jgi:DNA-binding PadR family transcriptional regulator
LTIFLVVIILLETDISLTDIDEREALLSVQERETFMEDTNCTERDPEAMLPLTPAVFHILLALADGEKHGYGIKKEVEERTEGKTRLVPGTLYGSISRMQESGLIKESGTRPDPSLDDERRRYYRLTEFGLRVTQAEARRLAQLVKVARSKQLLSSV